MQIKFDQQEISFIVGEFLRSKFNTEVAVTDVSASGTRSAAGLCLEANVHLGEITYVEVPPESEEALTKKVTSHYEAKKPQPVKSSDYTNGIDLKLSTELAQMEFDNPQMDSKELLDKMIEFAGEAAVYQKYSRHPRFSQLLNQPTEPELVKDPEPTPVETSPVAEEPVQTEKHTVAEEPKENPPFDVDTSATPEHSPQAVQGTSEISHQTVEEWLASRGGNKN